jgi:hypothetical protein
MLTRRDRRGTIRQHRRRSLARRNASRHARREARTPEPRLYSQTKGLNHAHKRFCYRPAMNNIK